MTGETNLKRICGGTSPYGWVQFGSRGIDVANRSRAVRTESFNVYPLPDNPGEVRQLHGRSGEVWGAESAADRLVLIRTR
jgi:streptogramin lyase